MVKDTYPAYSGTVYGPTSLTAVGSTLFFQGYSTNGYALWRCMTEYTDSGMEVVNEITYS